MVGTGSNKGRITSAMSQRTDSVGSVSMASISMDGGGSSFVNSEDSDTVIERKRDTEDPKSSKDNSITLSPKS